jgi:hypothetical protein
LWSDNPSDDQSGLWLLPYNTSGSFVLVFPEAQGLTGVRLRNTHNQDFNDFGTKDFLVEVSNASTGPWKPFVQGQLDDVAGVTPPPFVTFDAQFELCLALRFTAKSWFNKGTFWGVGVGSPLLPSVAPPFPSAGPRQRPYIISTPRRGPQQL